MTAFGITTDGAPVDKFVIGAGDLTVSILTWGAVVQDVRLAGVDRSLTLGSEQLSDYEGSMQYNGALIGPIANRIGAARIKIAGMMYELERNQDGRVHLHSGAEATHRRVWDVAEASDSHVVLVCHLPDGICGLPGNRDIRVTYRVSAPATLEMVIDGQSDATTAMNFANHSYWNLDGTDTWFGHELEIAAEAFLPTDADICPTGEIAPVDGTEMDFRERRAIIPGVPALDHNFCLSDARCPLRDVLTLRGQSGLTLSIATTEPGMQIYDGRDGPRTGGAPYEGLAIEAQSWPDAPNHHGFPSILVGPDAPYRQETHFRFTR